MSFSVAAGTLLKVSSGTPATFDASGYNALSWTTVGEVTDLSGFGPGWSIANHNPLALRGTQKKKTSRNGGSFTVTLTLDTDDTGQIAMKAARDSATAVYAAQINAPNGDKYYCQVLVTTFQLGSMNQSSLQTATATCEVQCSSTDVDWVESLA